MEDIFSQFGDIFGGHFSGGFSGFSGSGRGQRSQRVNKGSDLRVRVKLTLAEIAKGTTKKPQDFEARRLRQMRRIGRQGFQRLFDLPDL